MDTVKEKNAYSQTTPPYAFDNLLGKLTSDNGGWNTVGRFGCKLTEGAEVAFVTYGDGSTDVLLMDADLHLDSLD